jgi:hypothetical protein
MELEAWALSIANSRAGHPEGDSRIEFKTFVLRSYTRLGRAIFAFPSEYASVPRERSGALLLETLLRLRFLGNLYAHPIHINCLRHLRIGL